MEISEGRQRLFSTRLWLLFVFLVVVTAVLPIGRYYVEGKESTWAIYMLYIALAEQFSAHTLFIILLHLIACFTISLAVRANILRVIRRERSSR